MRMEEMRWIENLLRDRAIADPNLNRFSKTNFS